MSRLSRCFSLFVLSAIVASPAFARPSDAPPEMKSGWVRGLNAGAELMAIIDFVEVITYNEGVMENPADQVQTRHEPARSEKWKFGDQFERFSFDGRKFAGLWRSARFQDEYFVEFIHVEGEVAPGCRSVAWMTLTKTRFDRTSLEPPVNRGYTVLSLRFQDLQYNPGFGNSVTFRFVPGTSKVTINAARAEFLETSYHAETKTTWKGLKVDNGKNPVSGIPYQVFAEVTFDMWPPPGPPKPATAGAQEQTVTLVGDWVGFPEFIGVLSAWPGVKVVDRTTRERVAVDPEKDPADLPRADLTEYKGIVLEAISIGRDPRDISARVRIVNGDMENELWLKLDYGLFGQFGEEAVSDWLRLQGESFRNELMEALKNAGL